MLDIIKMDLFRLFKSKSFYIAMIVFSIIMGILMLGYDRAMTENIKPRDCWDAYKKFPLKAIDFSLWSNKSGNVKIIDAVSGVLSGYVVLLFTGIYTVLFITSEGSSRFLKNIVSCVKRRRSIIISKVVVMSVFVFIEFIAVIILIELFSLSGVREIHITHAITLEQLRYFGLEFLLYSAFAALIILVTYIVKNAAISMMIILLFCSTLVSRIMILFLFLAYEKLKIEYILEISNYLVVPNLEMLSTNAPLEICIRALLVAVAAIFVYSILNIIVIEKRDV